MRDELAELKERSERVKAGGGADKQHQRNKLTARERLDLLFDDGTFVEVDQFASHRQTEFGMAEREVPADAVVTGYGQVNGKTVYAFAQDFTVMGGTLGEVHASKICKVMDIALKTGSPFVGINDSGGARVQEGIDALNGFGNIFRRNTQASGVIPQISVIMGPCAGGAVYSPALTDFIFMVQDTSQMFITGPNVIKTVTGEEVSMEDLGGARVHNRKSGVAHFLAPDDATCIEQIRELLAYLPPNNLDPAPAVQAPAGAGPVEELAQVVPSDPNKPYDVRDIIRLIADPGSFLEVQELWATNAVVGFIRLGGSVVGVLGNQPRILAGCLDIDASDKLARFVRFCDSFNIPLLTLVDTPGYLPGTGQEHAGIIRHGAKLLYAYSEATVPKVSIILRKAYGGAYIAMCSRSLGADAALAWPTAEIAVMGPEGACNIVFRKEIASADDPETKRAEKVADYREKFANPYFAASRGYVDEVLDPRQTRMRLLQVYRALASKRESNPGKKHGNLPV